MTSSIALDPVDASTEPRSVQTSTDAPASALGEAVIVTIGAADAIAAADGGVVATLTLAEQDPRKHLGPSQELGGAPNDSAPLRYHVPLTDLHAFLVRHHIQELWIPDLELATHSRVLLDILNAATPLRRMVIESMSFDLTDMLDLQLAQLALVLADHRSNQQPA